MLDARASALYATDWIETAICTMVLDVSSVADAWECAALVTGRIGRDLAGSGSDLVGSDPDLPDHLLQTRHHMIQGIGQVAHLILSLYFQFLGQIARGYRLGKGNAPDHRGRDRSRYQDGKHGDNGNDNQHDGDN